MKTLGRFLKVTLVGGLLVVLPAWVSLLLLLKAIKGALAMLLPIAKLLPQWFVHEKVAALGLLLVICFGNPNACIRWMCRCGAVIHPASREKGAK